MTLISDINLFKRDPQLVAGTLLFLAGFIVIMGIITAEIFYPYEYTTSDSMISDLGSTHSSNDITIPQRTRISHTNQSRSRSYHRKYMQIDQYQS